MHGMRKPFVGLRLMGGLGNQMFQYACAYALAARMGASLYLDLGGFIRDPLREYALGPFCLPGDLWPIGSPLETLAGKLLLSIGNRLRGLPGLPFVPLLENGFSFDPTVTAVRKNCYLHGYWQSWKYFMDATENIRLLFSLERFFTDAVRDDYAVIKEGISVSLHIRRTDYTDSPIHKMCGPEYYEGAASLMRSRLPGCRFYVFSDDLAAARSLLKHWSDAVFMPMRSQEEDMLLMSACRHHIIANSSFSWWAAWLGEHRGAVTIAPAQWFAASAMQAQTGDLLPEHWMRL